MARARSDTSMTLEELCAAMDAEAPWPAEDRYIGDGGQSDWALYAEAARRRAEVAQRLGVADRFVAFLASHWRDRFAERDCMQEAPPRRGPSGKSGDQRTEDEATRQVERS